MDSFSELNIEYSEVTASPLRGHNRVEGWDDAVLGDSNNNIVSNDDVLIFPNVTSNTANANNLEHTPTMYDEPYVWLYGLFALAILLYCNKPVRRRGYVVPTERKPLPPREDRVSDALYSMKVILKDNEGNLLLGDRDAETPLKDDSSTIATTAPNTPSDSTLEEGDKTKNNNRADHHDDDDDFDIEQPREQSDTTATTTTNNLVDPTIDYYDSEEEDYATACVICFEQFAVGDTVSWAKNGHEHGCRHVFHEDCIRQWLVLKKKDDCPSCRSRLITFPFPEVVKEVVSATAAEEHETTTRTANDTSRSLTALPTITISEDDDDDDHEIHNNNNNNVGSRTGKVVFMIVQGLVSAVAASSQSLSERNSLIENRVPPSPAYTAKTTVDDDDDDDDEEEEAENGNKKRRSFRSIRKNNSKSHHKRKVQNRRKVRGTDSHSSVSSNGGASEDVPPTLSTSDMLALPGLTSSVPYSISLPLRRVSSSSDAQPYYCSGYNNEKKRRGMDPPGESMVSFTTENDDDEDIMQHHVEHSPVAIRRTLSEGGGHQGLSPISERQSPQSLIQTRMDPDAYDSSSSSSEEDDLVFLVPSSQSS